MSKYSLVCQHSDLYGNVTTKHTLEFTEDSLNEVLQNMELFLRGCGFYFKGNLDIVPYEDQFRSEDYLTEMNDVPQDFFDNWLNKEKGE